MAIKTLDDFQQQIENWHNDKDNEKKLHEYLNLSWEEYQLLVKEGQINV